MRLVEGQKAKDFEAKDIFDNEISLENLRGKKILLSLKILETICRLR